MNFVTVDAFTKRAGSTLYLGATVLGQIGGLYEFERLSGASYVIATANTNAYKVDSSFTSFKTGLLNNGIFDFVTFVDRLFMANGQDFFKYDGTVAEGFGLPPGISSSGFGITGAVSVGGGLSGIYIAGYGYENDRGYFGPVSSGITVSLNGVTFNSLSYYGMSSPAGYGVSAISLYRSEAGFVSMQGTTNISAGTAAFIDYSPLTNREQPDFLFFTMAPKYLEIYNNQLMLAGFSTMLSTVYWSDIGEPEGIRPESFAEVRTNDGDRITGIKSYLNDLMITKQRSFHKLSGDNPDNFTLQQITDQYGCLSNRTMVVYNNGMVFLDSKGIIKYNGANLSVLSLPIEDLFLRMNVAAALETATAIHNRLYNEIWFSFPIDGSTINNFTVIYDYVAESFAYYDGFNALTLSVIKGRNENPGAFYGGYTGSIVYFDDNVENDLGAGFTCLIQTRFSSLLGQSIEQQFRRFYLNLEPILGVTQPINMRFFTDYGSTVMATFMVFQNPFQTRVDFGLPAKTFSSEITHFSASLSLKVFGYTIEARYQRSV